MTVLSTTLLDAIEARANAATEGPWYIVGPPWNEGAPFVNAGSDDPHSGEVVCDFTYMGDDADWAETNNSEANADFVASARQDIPALLAELRRLQTRESELAQAVETLKEAATRLDVALAECDTKALQIADHPEGDEWVGSYFLPCGPWHRVLGCRSQLAYGIAKARAALPSSSSPDPAGT